jgi:hypothetical protein
MSATDKIGWDEVEDAAAKMFNIWVDGNELKWAKEAWRHLAAAGLTGATTILEITATKLRLVTLANIRSSVGLHGTRIRRPRWRITGVRHNSTVITVYHFHSVCRADNRYNIVLTFA